VEAPAKESGSTNLCHGLPYEVFPEFLESQMARKYQNISHYDTPTTLFIMYVEDKPVGYIGIRTKLDERLARSIAPVVRGEHRLRSGN